MIMGYPNKEMKLSKIGLMKGLSVSGRSLEHKFVNLGEEVLFVKASQADSILILKVIDLC